MTDDTELHPAVAVSFRGSAKTYDYLIPDGVTVMAGDTVVVATRNGEAKVTVVTVKSHSDDATAPFLRVFEEEKDDEEAEDVA